MNARALAHGAVLGVASSTLLFAFGACGARVETADLFDGAVVVDSGRDVSADRIVSADVAAEDRREAAPAPPTCTIGSALAVDQENTNVTDSAGGPTAQTFVATRKGYLSQLELSVRRCGGDPTDRVRVSVRDATSDALLGSVELADLSARCAGYPSLQASDPGVIVSLADACVRVEAAKRYRIVLEPLASSIRFGVRGGDGYAAGALERVDGSSYVRTYGDLVFRTFVGP